MGYLGDTDGQFCLGIHIHIWKFPEIVVPPVIIHFNRTFHEINHPAIGGNGVPPWMETSTLHSHTVGASKHLPPFQRLSSGPCWCRLFGDQCHVHRGCGPHVPEGWKSARNQVETNGRLPATGISLVWRCFEYIHFDIMVINHFLNLSNMNLLGPQ